MPTTERIERLEKLVRKARDVFNLNFDFYRRDMTKALTQTQKEIEELRVHSITQACSNGVDRKKSCALFGEAVEKIMRNAINAKEVGKNQNSYAASVRTQFAKVLNDDLVKADMSPQVDFFTSRDAENDRVKRLITLRTTLLQTGTDALLAQTILTEDKMVDYAIVRPINILIRQPSSQIYDAVTLIQVAIDNTLKEIGSYKIEYSSK